jgi:hypothetical protein
MWLPTDERRLLSGFYKLIGEVGKDRPYHESDLMPLLDRHPKFDEVTEYGKSSSTSEGLMTKDDLESLKKGIKVAIEQKTRVERANKMLAARGLVTLRPHQHEHGVILIGLTLEGYDLGRRYRSFWARTGLWFEQIRKHWISVLASFVFGIIGTLLTQRLAPSPPSPRDVVDHSTRQPTTHLSPTVPVVGQTDSD